MYLKTGLYNNDIIWVFSLSFQDKPKENNNCYDLNMQAQSIILNNIADFTKRQYEIFN